MCVQAMCLGYVLRKPPWGRGKVKSGRESEKWKGKVEGKEGLNWGSSPLWDFGSRYGARSQLLQTMCHSWSVHPPAYVTIGVELLPGCPACSLDRRIPEAKQRLQGEKAQVLAVGIHRACLGVASAMGTWVRAHSACHQVLPNEEKNLSEVGSLRKVPWGVKSWKIVQILGRKEGESNSLDLWPGKSKGRQQGNILPGVRWRLEGTEATLWREQSSHVSLSDLKTENRSPAPAKLLMYLIPGTRLFLLSRGYFKVLSCFQNSPDYRGRQRAFHPESLGRKFEKCMFF